jgi:PAS domain S-box-containing protein
MHGWVVCSGHTSAIYQAGFRFGKLGLDLVEKRGLDRFRARVYLVFAVHVAHWTQPLATSRTFLRRAFEAAKEAGDLSYAAYSCIDLAANLFASGAPLDQVEREAEIGIKFAQDVGFGLADNNLTVQFRLVRMLRGLTLDFGSFNDATFDESCFVRRFENNRELSICACWYWIRKLQAGIYAGDSAAAIVATTKVTPLLWTAPTQIEQSEYQFYGALAQAARYDKAPAEERFQHLAALADHHRQIAVWAENCPENFENRAALVGAEIARIEGRVLDAEQLYEQAIRSAHDNGFIQNEALAYELAARFYAARGFKQIADLYLRNARYGYLRWGAVGKVRQLDETYPDLRQEDSLPGPTSTIGAPAEQLDLATVIKVSQAVSGEIVLENLIDTLMRTAMEQAGAERALLIMPRGQEPRIEAEATTSGDAVTVRLVDEAVTEPVLPETVLHYVLRTRESVILDDAAAQSPFGEDSYIRQRQARSILCLPLLNQAKLIGVLYLENNLTPRVFAPARISVLKLLASQAAIALENAQLYRDVAERETKIRRLVDSNIIGIFIWDFDGRVLEANDEFLHMVGYHREDLVAGSIWWTDLTPPDWRDRNNARIEQQKAAGRFEPFEKEYTRKDGSRVPVLIGEATFEEGGNQGVAFVLDLTERKRVEAEARESERRYREAQLALAHANRVATLGQLTSSIAHEVNQPITAAVTYALAARRWLSAEPPNFRGVDDALSLVVKEGKRAGEVIGRIRALIKKVPARQDAVELNDAILEVIALTRAEAANNNVSVRTQLAEGLPGVQGDRVELQQVLLNLIVNAIEAMRDVGEEERELLISSRNEPDGVSVEVRDSGPGLTTAALDRVFEAFYTTKSGGLGLGLSICRSIIEAHNGRLWASANLPRGASFQFALPAIANTASRCCTREPS